MWVVVGQRVQVWKVFIRDVYDCILKKIKKNYRKEYEKMKIIKLELYLFGRPFVGAAACGGFVKPTTFASIYARGFSME